MFNTNSSLLTFFSDNFNTLLRLSLQSSPNSLKGKYRQTNSTIFECSPLHIATSLIVMNYDFDMQFLFGSISKALRIALMCSVDLPLKSSNFILMTDIGSLSELDELRRKSAVLFKLFSF
jgi:hypothetical protein